MRHQTDGKLLPSFGLSARHLTLEHASTRTAKGKPAASRRCAPLAAHSFTLRVRPLQVDGFRAVEIGPTLCSVLRYQVARRAELAAGDGGPAVLFVMRVRTVKNGTGRWEVLASDNRSIATRSHATGTRTRSKMR